MTAISTYAVNLLLLLLLSAPLCAQRCMTFQDGEKNGFTVAKLDSLYPSAMHADSTKAVFQGKDAEKFSAAWGKFYEELFAYCNKQGLRWASPTWCFNKIYFSKDGRIEYWLFNFRKSDNIPAEVQSAYLDAIAKFSRKHKIRIKASTPFTQCGSVTFVNREDLGK